MALRIILNVWNWLMSRPRQRAPGCSERANAQVAPSTTVKAPPSCLHDSQVSPFITAAGAPPAGAQRDGETREIATLAYCLTAEDTENYSEEQKTHGGSMTFNCTSLAESHPIRPLYIFPNSGWWGRAYEPARPAPRCYAARWLLSSRGALGG